MVAVRKAATLMRLLGGGRGATYADLQSALGMGYRSTQRWLRHLRVVFGADLGERVRDDGKKVFWIEGREEWVRRWRRFRPPAEELAALDSVSGRGRIATDAERLALATLRRRLDRALERPGEETP